MSIIRELIFKEWFKSFSASALVLYLLLTIANLISGFLRSNINVLDVILNHLVETPNHLKLIIPISCLMASLFSIDKFKNRNELTAIFSIGYSRKKFILDITYAALLVSFAQFIILAFIGPYFRSQRHHFIKDSESKFRNLKSKGLRASTIGSGSIWFKSERYFFSFNAYDKNEKSLAKVKAYFFKPSQNKKFLLEKIVESPKAQYDPNRGWVLKSGNILNKLDSEGFPVSQKLTNFLLPINEKPTDFNQIEADITTLSFINLFLYIKKLKQNGINVNEYMVLFLEKISTSLICIVFALLATISVFNPNRRNSKFGKNLIFIFVFTIVYWLVNSYFIQLGISSKINPFIACFCVPFIFLLFISYTFIRHRELR